MYQWSLMIRNGGWSAAALALVLLLWGLPAIAGDRARSVPDIHGLRVMLERHDRPVARILDGLEPERGRFMTALPKSPLAYGMVAGSVPGMVAGSSVPGLGLPFLAAPEAGGAGPADAMPEMEKRAIAHKAAAMAERLRAVPLGGAAARHRDYCSAAADRAAMEASVHGYGRSSGRLFSQADAVCAEATRIADETVFRRQPVALPER